MTTRSALFLAGLLALSACSHDSKRDNPLDPALTPPVELSVALDDTAGTATLTWTPYEGEALFAAYWIIRIAQAPEVVDTLTILPDAAATRFIDSTLVTGSFYSYRVSVLNDAGLEVPSQPQSIRPLDLPAVEIQDLQFDSRAATATLTWSTYAGSRFHAYRILRRTDDSPPEVIAEIDDISATSAVDGELAGNSAYHYQIVVLTNLGEEIESEERSGVFHEHLDTWPLDMEDGEYVRLYKEGGIILALVSGTERVRLLSFASNGQLLEEQELLGHPSLDIPPHTVALTLLPEGRRLLGLAAKATASGRRLPQLLAYDAGGSPLLREIPLEHDFESFGPSTTEVEGQVFLYSVIGPHVMDNVRFTSNERLLIDDTFDTPDLGEWELLLAQAEVEDGALRLGSGALVRRKVKASWHDVRLEVDVTDPGPGGSTPAIIVKADTLPSLGIDPFFETVEEHTSLLTSLSYSRDPQIKRLLVLPPLDSGTQPLRSSSHFAAAMGFTYRLRIEIDAGLTMAAIESPSWWPSKRKPLLLDVPGPSSLISLEDSWAFAVGDSLTRIAPGLPDFTSALDHPISEMRSGKQLQGPRSVSVFPTGTRFKSHR